MRGSFRGSLKGSFSLTDTGCAGVTGTSLPITAPGIPTVRPHRKPPEQRRSNIKNWTSLVIRWGHIAVRPLLPVFQTVFRKGPLRLFAKFDDRQEQK
jgi:hypothetical protein